MPLPTFVLVAIQMIQTGMPSYQARAYTNAITQEAEKIEVDPLILVGIIQHESNFRARAISKDGEDYGLMQVRARYYGGHADWLLNPEVNVRVGAYIIKQDIDMCRKHLHREPQYQEWLSCYTGSCVDIKHMCKPTKLTQVFEDYLTCLTVDTFTAQAHSQCQKIYDKQYSEQARQQGISIR